MSVLSDNEIINLSTEGDMIRPFHATQMKTLNVNRNVVDCVSYGTSCASYDVTLGGTIRRVNSHALDGAYDPLVDSADKVFGYEDTYRTKGETVILQPQEFILAHTYEYFRIPTHICANLMDKSTWARNGVTVQNTLLEPGWCGNLTLEIINHLPIPVALTVGAGIGQLVFHELTSVPTTSYNMRNGGNGGKYQFQTGVTAHRIK